MAAARGRLDLPGPRPPPRGAHARDPAPSVPAPDERASLAELRERLERALRDLPGGQRTVFLLRHEGGLSLREVADTLGVALPTARTQFARACLRLQRGLREFDPGGKRDPS